jgi:hypothetical protein
MNAGNSALFYGIDSASTSTWYDGAGGTRMTLNSTGLGVGVSPNTKLAITHSDVIGTLYPVITAQYASGTYAGMYAVRDGAGDQRGIAWQTYKAGTGLIESLRLSSDGNVGVGVTPSAWAAYKAVQIGRGSFSSDTSSGTAISTLFGTNFVYDGNWKYIVSAAATFYQQTNGGHYWFNEAGTKTAGATFTPVQAMTLDASGNLLVGRTGAGLDNTSGVTIGQASIGMQTEGNATQIVVNRTTSDGTIVDLRRNNSSVGNISVTTSGATFNSTSDYRLKESVAPLSGGLARVSALKPSIYKWKADGSNGEGFLAHELAEVVPAAVTGEKDAVNEDGSIKAQSIDMSRVVPILVAAIQELTARVQTLEAK